MCGAVALRAVKSAGAVLQRASGLTHDDPHPDHTSMCARKMRRRRVINFEESITRP